MRFAILGAGMAGILSAIKLKEMGQTDFTVYEKADRLGGTWRENTYPGLGCDVPSHLYSYSFALNPEWSQTYAPGPEICAYLDRVALDRVAFGGRTSAKRRGVHRRTDPAHSIRFAACTSRVAWLPRRGRTQDYSPCHDDWRPGIRGRRRS